MKAEQTPFMKINDAVKATGLSAYYLRNGCRDGSVPCVQSGTTYYINIPALLKKLGADGEGGAQHDGLQIPQLEQQKGLEFC